MEKKNIQTCIQGIFMCNVTLEKGAKLLNNIIKDNFPKLNKNMKLQIRRHIVYPKKKKKALI